MHKFDITPLGFGSFGMHRSDPCYVRKMSVGLCSHAIASFLSGSASLEAAQVVVKRRSRWNNPSFLSAIRRHCSAQGRCIVTYASFSLSHLLLLLLLPPIPRSQTFQLAPASGFESVYTFLHHHHYYHQKVQQHVFRNDLLRFQAQRQEGSAVPVGGSEGQSRAGHQHRQQMRLHSSIRRS